MIERAEALIGRAGADWTWVSELLRRADELRAVAGTIGVDLEILDNRVGNPRKRLMAEPLSSGSLEKAAASASLALAVLNDAVPEFLVSRKLRRWGSPSVEPETGARKSVIRPVRSLDFCRRSRTENLTTAAERLVETRRMVARIPRAPALAPVFPPRRGGDPARGPQPGPTSPTDQGQGPGRAERGPIDGAGARGD